MFVAPQGVDAAGLTQGASLLSRPADEYENDTSVESAWVVQACQYADIHWNLICSVDPKLLRLTAEDDKIYTTFKKDFPNFEVSKINEESLKSLESKQKWRNFLEENKDIPDYNFGTLLRLNCEADYSEENTTLVPRLQFLAIEIARNKNGLNDKVWKCNCRASKNDSNGAVSS